MKNNAYLCSGYKFSWYERKGTLIIQWAFFYVRWLSDIGDCHCVNFDRTLVRIEVCNQRNTAVAFLCHNVH